MPCCVQSESAALCVHLPLDADPLHPDGMLMFTIFGRELIDKLCMLGFDTTAHHLHIGPYGIIGENAW